MSTQTEYTPIAKTGTVLMLTNGVWDSFAIDGPVHVLKDFYPAQVLAEFKSLAIAPPGLWGNEHKAFIEYIEKAGLVAPVPHQVWHLGDYELGDDKSRFD